MKYAADFRQIARNALSNKWGIAIVAGLIATLLGGTESSASFELNLDTSGSGASINFNNVDLQQLFFEDTFLNETLPILTGVLGIALIIGLTVGIALFLIGSVVKVGYSKFNLQLVDGQEGTVGTLFSYMPHWKTMIAANFLRSLYIFFWSLLCVIPGIIASYSYAMVPYILAENPEMTASEAISASKAMMEGNRWRLFCMHFSFIGWSLLAALSCGIGNLFLTPYRQAAEAAFYREISGTWPMIEVAPPMTDIPA